MVCCAAATAVPLLAPPCVMALLGLTAVHKWQLLTVRCTATAVPLSTKLLNSVLSSLWLCVVFGQWIFGFWLLTLPPAQCRVAGGSCVAAGFISLMVPLVPALRRRVSEVQV